jgi:hypothetical protein
MLEIITVISKINNVCFDDKSIVNYPIFLEEYDEFSNNSPLMIY